MRKTYHGSCLCGAIKFESVIDLALGTHRCSCLACIKHGLWQAPAALGDVRIVRGADALREYRRGSPGGTHLSCITCGTQILGRAEDAHHVPIGWGVRVNTLDDLDPAELARAPIFYHDAKHDDFDLTPPELRHR